jgi:geranylgeranyl pyrophosphate synthase
MASPCLRGSVPEEFTQGNYLLDAWQALVENQLPQILPKQNEKQRLVQTALHYAVSGGHRWRPLVVMATYHAAGRNVEDVIESACAIELVHCCTLIIDDLPCVDNASIRRGKECCHRIYGEAVTIYASHLLFALAERLACENACHLGVSPDPIRDHFYSLRQRLINSQQLELNLTKGVLQPSETTLTRFYDLKSSPFFSAGWLAVMLAGVARSVRHRLLRYVRYMGIAYQLVDDILDVKGSPHQIGKSIGMDRGKVNIVSALGLERSFKILQQLYARAASTIAFIPGDIAPLHALMHKIVSSVQPE